MASRTWTGTALHLPLRAGVAPPEISLEPATLLFLRRLRRVEVVDYTRGGGVSIPTRRVLFVRAAAPTATPSMSDHVVPTVIVESTADGDVETPFWVHTFHADGHLSEGMSGHGIMHHSRGMTDGLGVGSDSSSARDGVCVTLAFPADTVDAIRRTTHVGRDGGSQNDANRRKGTSVAKAGIDATSRVPSDGVDATSRKTTADEMHSWPLFCFLPVCHAGLPFLLHAPAFELTTSRQSIRADRCGNFADQAS